MNFEEHITNSAKMLLIFITSIFCVTGVFFFFGISIGYFNLIVPFGIMLCTRYTFFDKKMSNYWMDVFICLAILSIAILMSINVYDNTWDGCAYHKQAVGLLKEGWNPVYMLSNDFNNAGLSIKYAKEGPLLWAESYPKATWYFAAAIYYFTGNIEAGKCYTLLFAYITYGMCLEFFGKKMFGKMKYLITLFIALNPIVCAQIQSYYLDGVVACVLSMLIIVFTQFIDTENEKISKLQYIEIGCLIIWGCNLKFSVVVFVVTICGLFVVFSSVKIRKIDMKNFFVLLFNGIIALFVFGFAPYITNLIRHGSMFYSLVGLMEETAMQKQFGISGLNRTGRFLASLFGKTSHGQYKTLQDVLKVPFTFSMDEFKFYSIVDARVGGFGVFFSGLLVVSLVIIIIIIFKIREKSLTFLFCISLSVISILEFCVLPQTSQFRYIPHMYLIIVFAMYFLLQKRNEKLVYKFVSYVCCIFIIGNILPWGYNAVQKINQGVSTTAILHGMEMESKENTKYEIGFYCDDFTGMHYNLKDFNINYIYKNIDELGSDYKVTYSNWLAYKEGD